MPVDVPIGTTLAGYRVERLLGHGAMGAVYLARDEHLDRPVALKLLPRELASDQRFRDRFLRESRLAATLEHPSIVTVYSAGEADGLLYLAMRFVDGGDLGELIDREGRLEPDRALDIVGQVAGALDAAHGRGLIHRDVKPGNILVSGERIYLSDFGLAKHASTVNSNDVIVGSDAVDNINGKEGVGRLGQTRLIGAHRRELSRWCLGRSCVEGFTGHFRSSGLVGFQPPPPREDAHGDRP